MIVKVSMRQCLGSLAKRNRTDMPSTQCGFSEAGTEWQAASLRDPELQQRQKKNATICQPRIYSQHFFLC